MSIPRVPMSGVLIRSLRRSDSMRTSPVSRPAPVYDVGISCSRLPLTRPFGSQYNDAAALGKRSDQHPGTAPFCSDFWYWLRRAVAIDCSGRSAPASQGRITPVDALRRRHVDRWRGQNADVAPPKRAEPVSKPPMSGTGSARVHDHLVVWWAVKGSNLRPMD